MKKIISIIILLVLNFYQIYYSTQSYGQFTSEEDYIINFGNKKCSDIKQTDIPTIFIPGILASWYSEEGYKESKIKRWIPDPLTHSYDTLFYTFKQNGYNLRDVFYSDEFNMSIVGNPKQSLYLFGYDWKKDNKITAKLLSNLIMQIREKYEQENGCDIGSVNIIGHSMGGLVARAMLEDICADEDEYKSYYLDKSPKKGNLKDFKTISCENYTRVNQLITISTPQRGSPSSFAIWTKGNILQTEAFIKGILLKGQLGVNTNEGLYDLVHGYSKNIANGIVTIGQLLPDLKENNSFNDDLLYLSQNGSKLNNYNHPRNSFLEELNKEENIDKLFSNISGKYSLYYSTVTSNTFDLLSLKTTNNTIGFNISKTYGLGTSISTDQTKSYNGKDIYGSFPHPYEQNVYNIGSIIKNELGLGGDGTVPTRNLLLVPNDTGKKIDNQKFESISYNCFTDDLFLAPKTSIELENELTRKLGANNFEICSHSKMPMLTSIQVLEKITGLRLVFDDKGVYSLRKEQEKLYDYLGYADYTEIKKITYIQNGITYVVNPDQQTKIGVLNNTKLGIKFDNNYNKLFSKKELENFINDRKGADRKSLDFSGKIGQLDSVLRYEILSPINLIIEDEQGRRIGIDPETGMIINEIPGAWTSGDTEGSNEPEFFLIPRTGTGKILNKIHSYGTGDGEYHIVMNEIKSESFTGKIDETANFVIAGTAKTGIVEDYLVGIEGNKANYKLIDTKVSGVLKKVELKEKYKDILEKLYKILDTKYTKKSKTKLKENLIKFREVKNNKYTNDEKISFLIDMVIEYIK